MSYEEKFFLGIFFFVGVLKDCSAITFINYVYYYFYNNIKEATVTLLCPCVYFDILHLLQVCYKPHGNFYAEIITLLVFWK